MKKTMNKTTKNNFINYGIVIAIFVIVEILSGTGNLSRLLTGLLVPLCVYTIAAISLNLVVGFSGELSLGHAGFMCVGAYSSALFSHIASDIPQVPRFILAILIGAAVAAVFGVIIGIPVLRLRGDYLAIVTLAFGEIIKNLINILYVGFDENGLHVATSSANLKLAAGGKQILKGALGISGTGALYKDVKHYFFPIGIILVLLTLFIVQNLVNSRSGRAIMATRDNRIAAESVGIDVTKFKLLAFTISAALAGVAGSRVGFVQRRARLPFRTGTGTDRSATGLLSSFFSCQELSSCAFPAQKQEVRKRVPKQQKSCEFWRWGSIRLFPRKLLNAVRMAGLLTCSCDKRPSRSLTSGVLMACA